MEAGEVIRGAEAQRSRSLGLAKITRQASANDHDDPLFDRQIVG